MLSGLMRDNRLVLVSFITTATTRCQLRLVPVLANLLRSGLSPVHFLIGCPVYISEMAIVMQGHLGNMEGLCCTSLILRVTVAIGPIVLLLI